MSQSHMCYRFTIPQERSLPFDAQNKQQRDKQWIWTISITQLMFHVHIPQSLYYILLVPYHTFLSSCTFQEFLLSMLIKIVDSKAHYLSWVRDKTLVKTVTCTGTHYSKNYIYSVFVAIDLIYQPNGAYRTRTYDFSVMSRAF